MKIINFMLSISIIIVLCFLTMEFRDYKLEQKEISEYLINSSNRLNDLEKRINYSLKNQKSGNKIQNNTEIENFRIEILSLLSVTVRYFLSVSEEQGNLIKLLENINAYNEAPDTEKDFMQKSLQENVDRLRKENLDLAKSREGLKGIVTNLKDNSLE